jgi:hypothetical protein
VVKHGDDRIHGWPPGRGWIDCLPDPWPDPIRMSDTPSKHVTRDSVGVAQVHPELLEGDHCPALGIAGRYGGGHTALIELVR